MDRPPRCALVSAVPDCVPRITLGGVEARFELGGDPIVCGEERLPSRGKGRFQYVIDPEGRAGERALFTVLALDPDPPMGLGPIVHYAAINVSSQGGPVGPRGMGAAVVLQAWRPPAPPANTGLHR